MPSSIADSPVLGNAICAWRADTIDDRGNWYCRLSESCLSAIDRALDKWRREQRSVTELEASAALRTACRAAVEPALNALESGRGFVIIEGVPVERYSAEDARAMYWLVGQLLGEPFEQNVEGTLFYDVRDTGRSVAEGARFSVTNYESSFHTDNSFGQDVLDYVGLLCLKTAKSGGQSQVLSGYAVYDELREKYPDAMVTLCQPFHVDRRGGTREGEAPTVRFPLIDRINGEILFRYLRYWIEEGHKKAGEPLTPAQLGALNTLDAVLAQPELRVEFDLRPGDMYFINNRWILHNRTAFQDHAEPERRRHLVRLWLKARP